MKDVEELLHLQDPDNKNLHGFFYSKEQAPNTWVDFDGTLYITCEEYWDKVFSYEDRFYSESMQLADDYFYGKAEGHTDVVIDRSFHNKEQYKGLLSTAMEEDQYYTKYPNATFLYSDIEYEQGMMADDVELSIGQYTTFTL